MTRFSYGLALAIALTCVTGANAALWSVTGEVDPITDQPSVLAVLADGANGLVVRCDGRPSGVASLIVISGTYLGSRPLERAITYRFDNDRPITSNWLFDRRRASITGPSPEIDQFVARLRTAKTLAVRAGSSDGSQVTFTLDVSGAAQPMTETMLSCS